MHRVRVTRIKWMPVGQVFAVGQQSIGTSGGQPTEGLRIVERKSETARYELCPVRIVCATAGIRIEQFTGNVGEISLAERGLFQLLQTAKCTAIAE